MYEYQTLPAEQGVHARDEALKHEFPQLVGSLAFTDVVVPMPRKQPQDSSNYSLVPISPWAATACSRASSLTPAGYSVVVPNGVETTFDAAEYNPDCLPFLDARQAIGLVFGKWLVAVAAAGIEERGVKIVQIQDVSDARTMPEDIRRNNGLRNGFWWQDTLVHAWEKVTVALGEKSTVIQSNENNKWQTVRQAGDRGYNNVASRRHYTRTPDGNWIKHVLQ